jgi:hypothetical protein
MRVLQNAANFGIGTCAAHSAADDHNSDKQSHDVYANCNTQLLQLPFKIEYHCTDKEIGSQVEMQVA